MATRLVQIALNARDDSALGQFWAAALGWSISGEGPGMTNLAAVCIGILAVPEGK